MIAIDIKPLSVNKAWKGKRYKTDAYKVFEKQILLLLPSSVRVPNGPLELRIEFGFSSTLSDWDNPIKPFQDCLQKKYGFDDKRVMRGIVDKVMVKKGQEYIKFQILPHTTELNKGA